MGPHDLLEQYLATGSPAVFNQIVENYSRLVYSVCYRVLGDEQAAQDAAQATFLVLLRKAKSLRNAVLSSWLYFTAQNCARVLRRSVARRVRHEREAVLMNKAGTDGVWDELRPKVDDAIARLSPRLRDALILRYVDGLSFELTAQRLGCPERTARTRVTRALDHLRQQFSRQNLLVTETVLTSLIAERLLENAPTGLATLISTACQSQALGTNAASTAALAAADMVAATALISKTALAVLTVACVVGATIVAAISTVPSSAVRSSAAVGAPARAQYYISPTGAATASGQQAAPWDLRSALSNKAVKPGDTLWLLPGTYQGGFVCELSGSSGKSVSIRAMPGQRVTIDNAGTTEHGLSLHGAWTIVQGLEFTNSDTRRRGVRAPGVSCHGPENKLINCVIHDTGGAATWTHPDGGGEVYGCLLYNNGYEDPETGRIVSTGLSLQNAWGEKRVEDNIFVNHQEYGIHAYGSDKAHLKNLRFEGNVWINDQMLVGGGTPAENIVIRQNYSFGSPRHPRGNSYFGYTQTRNADLVCQNNLFAGGQPLLYLGEWTSLTLTDNTFVGDSTCVLVYRPLPKRIDWNRNSYFAAGDRRIFNVEGDLKDFAAWQRQSQLDADSQAADGKPRANQVNVRRNRYESGRAHIIVYNWEGKPFVEVDGSDLLQPGSRYELRNAQDFYAAPVLSGTFDGRPLQIPMQASKPAAPVGKPEWASEETGLLFNAYVLLSSR